MEATEQAVRYCRAVYEAGFSPICPTLHLPLFLNDAVPEEHKTPAAVSRSALTGRRRNRRPAVTVRPCAISLLALAW